MLTLFAHLPERLQRSDKAIGRFVCMGTLTLVFFYVAPSSAQSSQSTPRDQLQQYVTQLQANPTDDALRTTIIQLALTLDPKPATPPEAIQHEAAAAYAFKNAQSSSDFLNAAAEYEKALLLVPWKAIDYYNMGACYGKEGDLQKAIAAYQFYLLAAPGAADADKVNRLIGVLKYQLSQKEAAEEAQRQQQEAQEQQEQQEEEQKQQQAQQQAEQRAQTQRMFVGVWRCISDSMCNVGATGIFTPNNFHWTFFAVGDEIGDAVCFDRTIWENGLLQGREGYTEPKSAPLTITGYGRAERVEVVNPDGSPNIKGVYEIDSEGNLKNYDLNVATGQAHLAYILHRTDPSKISRKCAQ